MTDPRSIRATLQRPDPELLLRAYASGVFPMANPDTGLLEWYSPDPRAIFPLDAFHVPASLARVVRSGRFEVTSDRDFEGTMRACAEPRADDGDGTWIDERLIRLYVRLHEHGFAHSVEARRDGVLVGGLYGVHLGAAFFGESMFSRPALGGRDASKVCLVALVEHLRRRDFSLLDTQFTTPHLLRFGCVEVGRGEYLERLERAVELSREWGWEGGLEA